MNASRAPLSGKNLSIGRNKIPVTQPHQVELLIEEAAVNDIALRPPAPPSYHSS